MISAGERAKCKNTTSELEPEPDTNSRNIDITGVTPLPADNINSRRGTTSGKTKRPAGPCKVNTKPGFT